PAPDRTPVTPMVPAALPVAGTPAGRRAIASGLNWVFGMQSIDGGYAAFDVNNTFSLWNRIPFADMEAMIAPPTEDITGRLLHCMGAFGFGMDYGRARRAVEYLRRTQRPGRSWWGGRGVQLIFGAPAG